MWIIVDNFVCHLPNLVHISPALRFQIIFPDLMMTDVYVYPSFNHFMNVDIYPSPNEMHNLVGLCGNFNGDTSDDFRLRDTGNQGSTGDFSLSWE